MKNLNLLFLILFISGYAEANTFECQTFLNLSVISSKIVETELNNKILADNTDVAISYLTQKNNKNYVLEVFIPESEMRIYSEASVVDVDSSLTASAWTRDYIIDVTCRKIN